MRIGTRGSPLALAQAHETRDLLVAAHDDLLTDDVEIVVISTKGDRVQDRALSEIGGKGLFTEEIEAGLSDGSLDIAVHSMKDMPTELPDGLIIPCLLPREDVRDVFISNKASRLQDLPQGAVIGSASLRRQAQIKNQRPDLEVVTFRGNVQSRLRKLEEGIVDATLLAQAGLNRLDMAHVATETLSIEQMLPAVAQGAIGIECREGDKRVLDYLAPLACADTMACVTAERAVLAALDGSCRTPIAALATLNDGTISLRALVLRPDGSEALETTREGPVSDALALGEDAGAELKQRAGPDFMTAS
ncbi:MAG: hydroxymethylbilane synthase [Alphaproteobacteria bacterium]|nr:hydroxymethylbilane synthase [Alphaproteobacteria bacterium]MBT4966317.1 hydroxymethylbilane synthase [Alphaproteobacteria bacterium]MBT5160022.1 hydroxymethylbilane synthase [Alphaproteobacteria bacterium]MBT5919977.1 hydroxymethylbilane synthase [Alphaproteobacteria bacterium]MBT6384869.1 hydroxymethylbilane synthase [Alphaproteobacteria bacterium]